LPLGVHHAEPLAGVQVVTDEQLMQGALERLVAEALGVAGPPKRDVTSAEATRATFTV
jgi:hypothetical protein